MESDTDKHREIIVTIVELLTAAKALDRLGVKTQVTKETLEASLALMEANTITDLYLEMTYNRRVGFLVVESPTDRYWFTVLRNMLYREREEREEREERARIEARSNGRLA